MFHQITYILITGLHLSLPYTRKVFSGTEVSAKPLATFSGIRDSSDRLDQEDLVLMNKESKSHLLSISFSDGVNGDQKNFYQALQSSTTDTKVILILNSSHQLGLQGCYLFGKSALLQQEVWLSNMSSNKVCQLISGFVQLKSSSALQPQSWLFS